MNFQGDHMITQRILFYVLIVVFLSSCSKQEFSFNSPDNTLCVKVFTAKQGELRYAVKRAGHTIIEESPLGLEFERMSFVNGLTILEMNVSAIQTDRFNLLTGKSRSVSLEYLEAELLVRNQQREELVLVFRLYNEGLGFRYKLGKQQVDSSLVLNELSGFKLPEGGKAWMAPYDTPGDYKPAYETYYEANLNTNSPSPNKEGWAFPCLFKLNDDWVLLTEADVHETYCSTHLSSPEEGLFRIKFPEKGEAKGLYANCPTITTPWYSPWRVIITGKELNSIFESSLVQSLSTPSVLSDTSWIEPGIASWSWWSDNDSPEHYSKLKEFIDVGHRLGWKHSLIDAKWDQMKGGTIEDLVVYAGKKGIKLWVWYNSAGQHNSYSLGPRDVLHLPEPRRKEFERISAMGIKGIKVDYIESDKQEIIQLYTDILKDAARYKLMVNFHGCKLPTGWERTYPHLMTMESVKGAENYKLDPSYPQRAAVCNTILPFTRNVVGSMDYTPATFSYHKYPHTTSYAHELALSVLFESGVQHLADDVKVYASQPGYILDFLRHLPSVWDESILLDAYPGSHAIIARRNGQKWFIAGIHAGKENQGYTFSLPFLSEKAYLNIITDGEAANLFAYDKIEVDKESLISVEVLPEGGFCGYIE